MTAGGSAQRKADEIAIQVVAARERLRALEKQAEAWAAGALGERLVAEALERCELDGGVLHDRLLRPGRSQVNLDHVVVSTSGVFVLDTKNWTGDLTVHQGTLWVHRSGPEGRRHVARDTELAKVGRYADEMAADLMVQVHPLVVLANEAHAGFEPQMVAGVNVVPVARLREWFMRQPVVFDDTERELVGRRCHESFPESVEPLSPVGSTAQPGAGQRPARNRAVSPVRPAGGSRANHPRRPTPVRPARARSGAGRAFGRVVVGAVLLLVLVSQAGRLSTMMSSVVVGMVTPTAVTHTSTPVHPLPAPKVPATTKAGQAPPAG